MQENYEKLKIFLQKCLISPLIKIYISVKENIYLWKTFPNLNMSRPFRLESFDDLDEAM